MKSYTIQVDGEYYAGEIESHFETVENKSNGWYTYTISNGKDKMVFTGYKPNAHILEGHINMKSIFERVFDAMRFDELEVSEIIIKEVKNDKIIALDKA